MILLAAIFLSALTGLGWPGTLEPIAWATGALLILLGLSLLIAGAVALGSALTPLPAPRGGAALRTGGVYRLVRHPMYGGGILIALGWSAIFATPVGLALTVVLGGFAELKARHEESWLQQTHPTTPPTEGGRGTSSSRSSGELLASLLGDCRGFPGLGRRGRLCCQQLQDALGAVVQEGP